MRDVVELYEPAAEEVGRDAGGAERRTGFVVDGNRELIGQALSNVVDNAIKYSAGAADKPAVSVTLERRRRRDPAVASPTMAPAFPTRPTAQRATERFVRLEQSRSQPGSGLGLSLAKAVMKFHGGRLDLVPADPGLIRRHEFSRKRRADDDGERGGEGGTRPDCC